MSMTSTATIDYTLGKLQPVFDRLSALGTAGWQTVIRQQYVYAIGDIVRLVFFALALYILIRITIRLYNRKEGNSVIGWGSYNPSAAVFTAAGAVLVAIAVTISVFMLPDIIGRFINPAWYAIQSILTLGK